jgi:hypothetical protein
MPHAAGCAIQAAGGAAQLPLGYQTALAAALVLMLSDASAGLELRGGSQKWASRPALGIAGLHFEMPACRSRASHSGAGACPPVMCELVSSTGTYHFEMPAYLFTMRPDSYEPQVRHQAPISSESRPNLNYHS